MSDVACTTDSCTEHEVRKSNPGGIPAEEIVCGTCGGPVADVADDPPADAT